MSSVLVPLGWPLLLAGGLGVCLVLMLLIWVASLVRSDASLVDRFWGFGFVVLAWYAWFASGQPPLGLVMVLAVTAWGLRLSLYLTVRNWGHGEDSRYAEMRARHGSARFRWVSLSHVFGFQGLMMWLIAMPVFAGSRAGGDPILPVLVAGCLVWSVGFLWETVADWQMAAFKARPENRGKVMSAGLWRYSRHPNYFGEIVVWLGYFLMAAAVGGWWTGLSALLMIGLLVQVSGVTLLEQKLKTDKPGYREYMTRTNALIPWRPRTENGRS